MGTKITRKTAKLFASNAGGSGVAAFGTTADGSTVFTTDIATIQNANFEEGLAAGIIAGTKRLPVYEEINGVYLTATQQIAYILQNGIPEYDSGTEYFISSIVRKINTYELYGSIGNNNIGNALPSAVTNANWEYLGSLANLGGGKLTGNTTYYVATTGNDTTGTGAIGAPWLTIQKAVDYIYQNVDTAGYTATIQVADGTYTGAITVSGQVRGGGEIRILGNTTTPANVAITVTGSTALRLDKSAVLSIAGVKISTITSGSCIVVTENSVIIFDGAFAFGACASNHMSATYGGVIKANTAYTIDGNAAAHWSADALGVIDVNSVTVTLTGSPAFSVAFASCNTSKILAQGLTFSGSATGVRYSVFQNGVINTSGGGASYLPGSIAGSASTGGQYV